MTTLSLRPWVRNPAAVFAGRYGAVTRRAEQAGCSRQTVYEHARQIERRLRPVALDSTPAEAAQAEGCIHAPGPGYHRPPDRGAVPRDPPRRRPRSLDHRPLGRRRGKEGRTCPGGARRGVRPPDPDTRPRRDLFGGRPTLVGI